MMMRHETTDLFEAAYMMAEGAELGDVRREEWHGGTVVFELEGTNVESLRELYLRDRAVTNIRNFQAALTRAKDVMFALIRAREIQEKRIERRAKHGRREKVSC